jgi:hypothetical protein
MARRVRRDNLFTHLSDLFPMHAEGPPLATLRRQRLGHPDETRAGSTGYETARSPRWRASFLMELRAGLLKSEGEAVELCDPAFPATPSRLSVRPCWRGFWSHRQIRRRQRTPAVNADHVSFCNFSAHISRASPARLRCDRLRGPSSDLGKTPEINVNPASAQHQTGGGRAGLKIQFTSICTRPISV